MSNKIEVKNILYEICEDELVYDENINLVDSGLLDSYAIIELFSRLEDYNVVIQPTRIDRTKLQTIKGIESLIEEYLNNTNK